VRDKKKLTQELVALLPEEQRISPESAFSAWWYNLRSTGGLRLTTIGHDAFVKMLDLENYSYEMDNSLLFNQQTILKLDRKMQMPYYIDMVKKIPKRIVLFGSQEAVMVNLYGNLQQFLDNYQP
jgi:hypothetical protein